MTHWPFFSIWHYFPHTPLVALAPAFWRTFACQTDADQEKWVVVQESKSCLPKVELFSSLFVICACAQSGLTVTPQTVALCSHAPLSMRFSRQEYQSESLRSPPGDLPHPGTGLLSPASPALAGGCATASPTSATWEAQVVEQPKEDAFLLMTL